MQVTVYPSKLSGQVTAAPSKSSMQRACAAALLRRGESIIYNSGTSNDDLAAIDLIQKLGAIVAMDEGKLVVTSHGVHPIANEINCGESGLSIRMFTPIAAISANMMIINGEGSLVTRPMDFFDETLPLLGVHIQSSGGKVPITIRGPIRPNTIQVDGSLSSQFLTGLLMAFASLEQVTATINVSHLTSKPYVDLTLEILRAFGLNTPINQHYESFVFIKRNIPPSDNVIHYTVESDWSGAAFLLIAGAIAGHIVVKGLDLQSTQADRKILDALRSCGCKLSISNQAIDIAPPAAGLQDLKPFQFDATDCPDLFPPLVALASYCKGTSVIQGVNRLAHKESDRGLTLQEEFGKAGVEIVLENNVMLVHGGNGLQGGQRHSHHDHRIAMACAVAALKAEGHTTIEGADAINKSYPNFYQHLQQLGGKVQVRACVVPPLN